MRLEEEDGRELQQQPIRSPLSATPAQVCDVGVGRADAMFSEGDRIDAIRDHAYESDVIRALQRGDKAALPPQK